MRFFFWRRRKRFPERIKRDISVRTTERTKVEFYTVADSEFDIRSSCALALGKVKQARKMVPFDLEIKKIKVSKVWYCSNCQMIAIFELDECPYCGSPFDRTYGEQWMLPMLGEDISPVSAVPAVFVDAQMFAIGNADWDAEDLAEVISKLESDKDSRRRVQEFERLKRYLYADYFLVRAHFVQFTGDIKHPIEFVLIPKNKIILDLRERTFLIHPTATFLPATDPVLRAIESMGMRYEDLVDLGFRLEGREWEVVEFPTSEKAKVLEEYLAKTRKVK